jgi:hypothetical protein
MCPLAWASRSRVPPAPSCLVLAMGRHTHTPRRAHARTCGRPYSLSGGAPMCQLCRRVQTRPGPPSVLMPRAAFASRACLGCEPRAPALAFNFSGAGIPRPAQRALTARPRWAGARAPPSRPAARPLSISQHPCQRRPLSRQAAAGRLAPTSGQPAHVAATAAPSSCLALAPLPPLGCRSSGLAAPQLPPCARAGHRCPCSTHPGPAAAKARTPHAAHRPRSAWHPLPCRMPA